MTIRLKLMGYWSEPGSNRPYPDPKDLVDAEWHPDLRARIVDYLLSGTVFIEYWGYDYCRFEGGPPPQEMGSKELTDGVFVWPEGLPVYISRFNVVLPEEFVDHVKAHNFKVPAKPDICPERALRIVKASNAKRGLETRTQGAIIDDDYWIEWAAKYLREKQ